jgi:hypothetical protein
MNSATRTYIVLALLTVCEFDLALTAMTWLNFTTLDQCVHAECIPVSSIFVVNWNKAHCEPEY